jgi:cyclin-dependent kinase 12/13
MIGEVLFKGDKSSRQLELIYEKCGSPDELNWPGVKIYNLYDELGPKRYYPRVLQTYMKNKNNWYFLKIKKEFI